VYDIGAVSMRLLTKYMKHEEITETKVMLPYHLVERESK
jgi:LacI family transcriptional regulator